MAMMMLLGGSPALLKGLHRSASVVPCSRSRSVVVRADAKNPSWKLEKPNRLWELGHHLVSELCLLEPWFAWLLMFAHSIMRAQIYSILERDFGTNVRGGNLAEGWKPG